MSDNPAVDPAELRLCCAAAEGCEESRLLISRRAMLGVSAGLFSWAFMPRYAMAGVADPRLLVVILRGGLDGLSAVVPAGKETWSVYRDARGGVAVPFESTIPLAGTGFGLHPALKNFGAYYRAGDASVVHAVGIPMRTRSHFDAQDNLENGRNNVSDTRTGWLNRLLQCLERGDPLVVKGAAEIGQAPLILRGPVPVIGWSPTKFDPIEVATRDIIRDLYRVAPEPKLLSLLDQGLKGARIATNEGVDTDTDSVLTLRGFRGAARLLAAADGPRIAALAIDGFDTHVTQGIVQANGDNLPGLLALLDNGLGEFKALLGATWAKTVVVIVTEFGRRVKINGGAGTDHGTGTVALLAGGAVAGGKVVHNWPGLARLYDGRDLAATIDVRSIFKGVLHDHLGVSPRLLEDFVFPDSPTKKALTGLIETSTAAVRTEDASLLRDYAAVESPIARYRREKRLNAAAMAT